MRAVLSKKAEKGHCPKTENPALPAENAFGHVSKDKAAKVLIVNNEGGLPRRHVLMFIASNEGVRACTTATPPPKFFPHDYTCQNFLIRAYAFCGEIDHSICSLCRFYTQKVSPFYISVFPCTSFLFSTPI